MPLFSGNPPPPSGNESLYGFLSQLAAFSAQTKFLLNAYPYRIWMTAPSIKEFEDEFCTSSYGYDAGAAAVNSAMGIPVMEMPLIPDHEAWVLYRDYASELGYSIKKIKWGKPESPLSGAVDK